MAVGAYILIQTCLGQAAAVAAEVGGLPAVSSADTIAGPYDVIARATTETVEELGRVVVTRIQMVEGITRTLTCPMVSEH